MLTFRSTLKASDPKTIRDVITSTDFFEAAPDEVNVAQELAETAIKEGQQQSGYHFIFAEKDGNTVGYACFGPIPCTVGSFDLYWIAVRKTEQGKNIGKAIMEKIFEAVKKKKGRRIYLETSGREQYLSTHRFYESCGFTLAARLGDYYGPDDDMLIFFHTL